MRAIEMRESAGGRTLHLIDRPALLPGPGEVVLRLRAASLNYRDLAILRGDYPAGRALPYVPGSDGAGVVAAVGPGVTRVRPGQRAAGHYVVDWLEGPPTEQNGARRLGGPLDGTLADEVLLPEQALMATPDALTDEEMAALPIAGVTAWSLLFEQGQVRPGETVVVQGTGGVSLFAVQLAAWAGARVIVTSSSDEKLARALRLGAHHGLNYRRDPAWDVQVRALTNGAGADHVIDVAGGAQLSRSLLAARLGGRVVVVGFVSGQNSEVHLPTLIRRQLRLQGVSGGSRKSFEGLTAALASSGLRPVLDSVFGLDEVPAAFARLAEGQPFGKVVVRIA
jgi:NADPH:quinone reductase-like Zn-dependent oxidoreductase